MYTLGVGALAGTLRRVGLDGASALAAASVTASALFGLRRGELACLLPRLGFGEPGTRIGVLAWPDPGTTGGGMGTAAVARATSRM